MSKINKKSEILICILIFLVIFLLIPYFITHYSMIIIFLLEGKFNLVETMDVFYIIHTIVLSIIIFAVLIFWVLKTTLDEETDKKIIYCSECGTKLK